MKHRLSRLRPRIGLHQLILALSLSSVTLVLVLNLFISYQTQRDLLERMVLESNQAYAAKLATSIDEFVKTAVQQLTFSAEMLQDDLDTAHRLNPHAVFDEVKRLNRQTNSFNSVIAINLEGTILATDPDLGVTGKPIVSEAFMSAVDKTGPWVSPPFVSSAGNLLTLITVPITDPTGRPIGVLGGSIYLLQDSALHTVLSSHYYNDGSYLTSSPA